MSIADYLPEWTVDLILVGLGLILIALGGPLGNGNYGDGETAGAGAVALGAGLRGLMTLRGEPPSPPPSP